MWSKKKFIAICFALFMVLLQNLSCYSQDKENLILVQSKLWTFNGDTIEGDLIYNNQYNFQFNLTLADTSGNTIEHYSPKELAGFMYQLEDEVVEYESMLNPVDIGRVFLRVLYRGQITVYQFLEINYRTSVLSFLTYYYLWDGEWLEPPLSLQNETETLLDHFSDCPELEYKIKTQQYDLSDIRTILQEYEHCKLTDDYEFFYE